MFFYYFLFRNYYDLVQFIVDSGNTGSFKDPEKGSCVILSTLELLNIITVGLVINLTKLTGFVFLDVTILYGCLYLGNYFIFLRKKKYKEILKSLDSRPEWQKAIGVYLSFAYAIGTIYFFSKVNF